MMNVVTSTIPEVFWRSTMLQTVMKPSLARAILTDPQFWLPLVVLILGVGLLILVGRT
jgi:hypothetical protein